MTVYRFPFAILLLCLACRPGFTQPQFGVVWDVPVARLEIEADLRAIRDMGFTAVRTGLIEDAGILQLADSVGIDIYQEVEIALATAPELADRVTWIQTRISRALAVAEGHGSARHFGLAYAPASDRAETCNVLTQLVAFVRPRVMPGTKIYYVSWLPATDQCTAAVDFVLLDDARHDLPARLLRRYRSPTPFGLAAVGMAVDPEAERGTRVPGSVDRQAAFMAAVLDTLSSSRAEVVFVYRWRDPHARAAAVFQPAPYGRLFGLQDETGRARPAREVAERKLTRGQTAFALEHGRRAADGSAWFLLAGWFVLVSITVMLGLSPRFRATLVRYFMAHGFYRQVVQGGRDTPGYVTAGLLVLFGLMIGLVASYASTVLPDEPVFHALWHRSGPAARVAMDSLADGPVLVAMLAGGLGLVAMVTWLAVWSFAARRTGRLVGSQALILAVWPRWPMVGLTLAIMIASTYDPTSMRRTALAMLAVWLITAFWGTVRTGLDLGRVMRMHPVVGTLLWLFSPVVLLMGATAVSFLVVPEVIRFYGALIVSAGW